MSESSAYPTTMNELLWLAVEKGASDVHLAAGRAPLLRINRELVELDYPVMQPKDVSVLLEQILEPRQLDVFEKKLELDFAYSLEKLARFRGNAMLQRNTIAIAMRIVPFQVPNLGELGLPPGVRDLCFLPRGLVLVTGPTGSGKSTTLAGMIDLINRECSKNIITVEDPIEFLHKQHKSSIKQREVGFDTHSFGNALRHVLRHDPDVILIGEMRDLESIHIALTAAETGHLVLSTLHTQTAPLTVNRIVDVFDEHTRNQIRQQLAGTLQAIISQQLVPTVDGTRRVPAVEFLTTNAAVRNIIREGREHQLYSLMQGSKASGMITMDQSLAELVTSGKIRRELALECCVDRIEMENMFQRQLSIG